jgi:hypothetical protein
MAALYKERHEGAALVVGYAPSVRLDVTAAQLLRPGAVLLGVKYAAVLYQEIEHVWTQHTEQAPDIRVRAGRKISIHGRPSRLQHRRSTWVIPGKTSDLDYAWPSLSWVYGGSGFCAGLWARHGMGFSEVILCGIPMDTGGYAPEIAQFKVPRGDGGKSFVDAPALARWRNLVSEFLKDGRAAGITSMSGWTRSALGAPC